MLVHKGGQINNVQLITGVGSTNMSYLQNCSVKIFKEHCEYFTKNIEKEKNKKMKKREMGCGGGGSVGWMGTKSYFVKMQK